MKISANAALAAFLPKGINMAARTANNIITVLNVKISTLCLGVEKESSPSLRL